MKIMATRMFTASVEFEVPDKFLEILRGNPCTARTQAANILADLCKITFDTSDPELEWIETSFETIISETGECEELLSIS